MIGYLSFKPMSETFDLNAIALDPWDMGNFKNRLK